MAQGKSGRSETYQSNTASGGPENAPCVLRDPGEAKKKDCKFLTR